MLAGMRNRRWLAAFLLVFLSTVSAIAEETPDGRSARVDALFSQYSAGTSPGLALAVVRDGKVLLRKGYGLATLEHRVPITPATVFDAASVSKQFAGFAIASLVAQGRISLSDDIRKHIPEMKDIGATITVGHLLHHTSGIRDWPGALSVAGWRFDDVISFDQILRMAYEQRSLNFRPGAEHLYSNTGYNLLAELVERVTGETFAAWTAKNIFRPLEMTNTRFRDDHREVIRDRAFGYAREMEGVFRHVPNNLTALGSSSMFTTVDDMARWMINFQSRAVGNAAIPLMLTEGKLNDGSAVRYAFGVLHGTYRGLPMFTHSGSWASFSTYMAVLPEQKYGVVVLANSSSISAQEAVIKITNIYLEHELEPEAAASMPPAAQTADVPPAVLESYGGLYRLGPGRYLRVRRDGTKMTVQATHEGVVATTPRSELEFWVENYGAPIRFIRDELGSIVALEYRGTRAPRVDESGLTATSPLADYAGEYESEELNTSYRVVVNGESIDLHHRRHGTISLVPLVRDEFGSKTWFLASIEFRRDAEGRVTGFVVNGDRRSRDIVFSRRR